jgi:hypothetical protein
MEGAMQRPLEKENSKQKKKESDGASSDRNAPDRTRTGEARHEMIAEAAYYRAEKRGFQNGDPVFDWLAAEAEIDEQLSEPGEPPSAIVLELENRW